MKRRLDENKHVVDLLFVMAIFLVFTFSALMLILVGTKVYKNTVEKMDKNFETRTSFAYLTEKLRQADRTEGIEIGEFNGNTAIIMKEDIEGNMYATYIYLYDGHIKELFTSMENSLAADAGQDILIAEGFDAQKAAEGLYKVSVTPPGERPYTFFVSSVSGSMVGNY